MENTIHAFKYAKQRRFLMMLPLLTLPFLTLMFWAFGGGKGSKTLAQSARQQGLNLKLPDATLKDDKTLTKLSFYQLAARDSAKTRQAEKLDPYWRNSDELNMGNLNETSGGMDANQLKVYDKLDELKKALNKKEKEPGSSSSLNRQTYPMQSYTSSDDVERLRSMMQKINDDKTEDPEITQLNEMLDKIQAIQNPDQNKAVDKTITDKNFTVKTNDHRATISLLKIEAGKNNDADTNIAAVNNFYGISSFNNILDSENSNAIEAIIPETQTLVAGSNIKLTLHNDVTIQHLMIPAGTAVFGTVSLSNERLRIAISSIRYENSILPVKLAVYDMDGQEGIYIPGSIDRTAAKESANNAIGGIDAATINPSIGAQMASAGIETAKNMFSKKIKLIKITVRSGYKVLLKDVQDN
jgi:conjugative transposon TraM protein